MISYYRMSCYNYTVPSSPPRDVTVESHNPASLMLSWRPPPQRERNGPIIGYVVQYTRVGSNDTISVNVTSGSTHTISGLVAYVNYSVIVAAMTVNGTGPFSDHPVVGRSGEDCELVCLLCINYVIDNIISRELLYILKCVPEMIFEFKKDRD